MRVPLPERKKKSLLLVRSEKKVCTGEKTHSPPPQASSALPLMFKRGLDQRDNYVLSVLLKRELKHVRAVKGMAVPDTRGAD